MDYEYICIDLKSFYASVECVERGLDPMKALLVVADPERSEGTLCLAVSPALKAMGVRNRCRVFEIPKGIDYITAPPRMSRYIQYSSMIYALYLRYVSKDDIHVYSIDESFIYIKPYLELYRMSAKEFMLFLMEKINTELGVVATGGIGTNMYLAKIAMDIMAKHSDDLIGVLNENTYRLKLWDHRPLTDFWRIGKGTAQRLEKNGIYTMRDVAEAPEDLIYKLFGVDAELLIDHAWGRESATIADIKKYTPKSHSMNEGQVLLRDYSRKEAYTIVKEMSRGLALNMIDSGFAAGGVSVAVGYANGGAMDSSAVSFETPSSSVAEIVDNVKSIYKKITDDARPVRRIYISLNRLSPFGAFEQLTLFEGGDAKETKEDELRLNRTVIDLKKRFGRNSVINALDLKDEATLIERNGQIGGHKSGETTGRKNDKRKQS